MRYKHTCGNLKFLVVLIFFVFLFLQISNASSHYTYEHAEEMKNSGGIDWRDYSPDTFNEAIDDIVKTSAKDYRSRAEFVIEGVREKIDKEKKLKQK